MRRASITTYGHSVDRGGTDRTHAQRVCRSRTAIGAISAVRADVGRRVARRNLDDWTGGRMTVGQAGPEADLQPTPHIRYTYVMLMLCLYMYVQTTGKCDS